MRTQSQNPLMAIFFPTFTFLFFLTRPKLSSRLHFPTQQSSSGSPRRSHDMEQNCRCLRSILRQQKEKWLCLGSLYRTIRWKHSRRLLPRVHRCGWCKVVGGRKAFIWLCIKLMQGWWLWTLYSDGVANLRASWMCKSGL